MAITISGENNNDKILASDGVIDQISGINIVGLITASHINVGSNIQLGNAGIITATTFVGNVTGNVNSTSPLLLQTGGSERFRITGNNELGIAGANYGSSGQVLTSGGSGSAVTWSTPAVTGFTSGADNRVITASSASAIQGEANLTFDGSNLGINGDLVGSNNTTLYSTNGGSGVRAGLSLSGSDQSIKFYTVNGGSERLRINSSGFIGMGGNTNPTNVLHIKTAVTNTAVATIESTATNSYPFLRLKNDAREYQLTCHGGLSDAFTIYDGTSSAHRFTITSDGLIGINDTDTTVGLSINKFGTQPVTNGNTYPYPAGNWSTVWNTGTANSTDYWCGFVGSYNVSSATVNISLSPNTFNFSTQQGIYIAGEATTTSSSDFTVGKIIGGSAGGASASAGNQRATKSEMFRITSEGKVGINETSPQSILDVRSEIGPHPLGAIFRKDYGGDTTDSSHKIALTIWGQDHNDLDHTTQDGYGPMIGFGARNDDAVPNTGDIRAAISYVYNGDLSFHAEAGGSVSDGSNERLRIDGVTGNIGIQNKAPQDKLSINQGAIFQRNYYNDSSSSDVKSLMFPLYLPTGTHIIADMGNTDSGTVGFAKLDYVCLYSYAGTDMGMGTKYASTRRTNSDSAWRDFDDQTGQNNGENRRPVLAWTNGQLSITVGGSVQMTGMITIFCHSNSSAMTLTRNISLDA